MGALGFRLRNRLLRPLSCPQLESSDYSYEWTQRSRREDLRRKKWRLNSHPCRRRNHNGRPSQRLDAYPRNGASRPSVADDHHWIEEGLATYVEPIARVRAGHMDAHEMWFELVRDLHQGLPEAGDQGLDHTLGRAPIGAARYSAFLADVEIRKQTHNRRGLADALRGILNAGGDIRHGAWEALRIGDRATGVAVLVPLYNKMKDQPYDVDLPAMWKDLGVERSGDTVNFINSAPLAKVREAITFGAPHS